MLLFNLNDRFTFKNPTDSKKFSIIFMLFVKFLKSWGHNIGFPVVYFLP